MSKVNLNENQVESLWRQACLSGMPRRKFLSLLAGSGAAAVLTACKVSPSTNVTPAANVSANVTPPAPAHLIVKPTPPQYFVPLGTNAEMRFEAMANRAYQMPNSLFFVRSHSWTPLPAVDVTKWKLSIEGDGINQPFTMTYDELLAMPATTVTRFIECAGNGRSFYTSLMNKPAQGGQWRLGAYGIADWTGVKLSDLLNRAGLKSNAVDVMPVGFDSTKVQRPMSVAKAMESDTLVAYMMNGEILPVDHGFPTRLLTPGWVGIANIKWLDKIIVSTTPLYVDKNTTSYVLVGPDYQPQPPAKGPVLTDNIMKSACCLPWPAVLKAGSQKVVGYAWSPFGKINKVDVSIDGGKTFQGASLVGPNIERAGTRWELTFNAVPGNMTITPRAADEKGNVQYDVSQQKWNEQGYLFGAMVPHPVTVNA